MLINFTYHIFSVLLKCRFLFISLQAYQQQHKSDRLCKSVLKSFESCALIGCFSAFLWEVPNIREISADCGCKSGKLPRKCQYI